jgi:hypothetical protein
VRRASASVQHDEILAAAPKQQPSPPARMHVTDRGNPQGGSMIGGAAPAVPPKKTAQTHKQLPELASILNPSNDTEEVEEGDSSQPIRTDFQSVRKLDDDPRRANIVLEILMTEETYIHNMEQMIKVKS